MPHKTLAGERAWRKSRRKAGMCTDCQRKAHNGGARCKFHAAKNAADSRRRYYAKKNKTWRVYDRRGAEFKMLDEAAVDELQREWRLANTAAR